MVRLSILHETNYRFSRPVFLEPHTFRFHPRTDGGQRPLAFDLAIDPAPAGCKQLLDALGNVVTCAWFSGQTDALRVRSTCEVETFRDNPFGFLVTDPAALELPVRYAEPLKCHLDLCLGGSEVHQDVARWTKGLVEETGAETLGFLSRLTQRVQSTCNWVVRHEGDPHAAERTLADGEGSCRDLAVLFMDACRSVGLAARFVSGYNRGDPGSHEHELHAWAEVYLPGGGWLGYDPSQGLAIGNEHVVVAAGPTPRDAAPISGTLRGTGATVVMEHAVTVRG